jgi:hypothetical protein
MSLIWAVWTMVHYGHLRFFRRGTSPTFAMQTPPADQSAPAPQVLRVRQTAAIYQNPLAHQSVPEDIELTHVVHPGRRVSIDELRTRNTGEQGREIGIPQIPRQSFGRRSEI